MATRQIQVGDRLLTCEDAIRGGIRWAVGAPDGPRSSTWRLWGNKKGDVYLSVRNLGGIVKASFHRDRRCQVGFTAEYAETAKQRFGTTKRHWERWVLPSEPVVRAVQVVVPASELVPFEAAESPNMKWLPGPPVGMAAVVSIFIVEPPTFESWPGAIEGAQPLGIPVCPTRLTWAVVANSPLDASSLQKIEEARHKAIKLPGAADAPRIPGVRAVIWGSSTGSPQDLYFFELNWANRAGLRP